MKNVTKTLHLALMCLVIAGGILCCTQSGVNGSGSGSRHTNLTFSIGAESYAKLDLTLVVTDLSSMAVIFNQTYLLQSPPLFLIIPVTSGKVSISLTVTVHLVAAAAIHNGANSTAGTTLTDGAATFNSPLPLFVVDNPAAPAHIADVQLITSPTTLLVSPAFPVGPYFLYWTHTIAADFSWADGSDFLQLGIPTDQIGPVLAGGSV